MTGHPPDWEFDEIHDSAGRVCGDFLIDLRKVMGTLDPGAVVMIVNPDTAARAEIPAWSRLTGHSLLASQPPFYLVRKCTRT